MKHSMLVGVMLLMGVGGAATAGPCSDNGYGTQLKAMGANSIGGALNNMRILATGGGEEWNEDHCSNGALYKVGVGPTDPVDPRAFRGIWSVSGGGANTVVNYNYTVGGNSSFSWKLWQDNAGGLCWDDDASLIATAPAPGPLSGTCAIP